MHQSIRAGALRLCAALFAVLIAAPASGASLEVAPTKLVIDGKSGSATLSLANRGNTHLQITDFALYAVDASAPIASDVQLAYALAGQAREWTLRVSPDRIAAQSSLRVRAQTDAGEIEATVPLRR